MRPRPETIISRSSTTLALRIALGAGRLAALYLATHAVGSFFGWQVMADAEPREALADVDDDEQDEDDGKASKSKVKTSNGSIPYGNTQPDVRQSRVTKYNVFCPTCVPVVDEPGVIETPLGGTLDVQDSEYPDAIRTSLPLALVATMEAEDPGISLATISHSGGGTGVYAEGDAVLDEVTLLAVDLGIVYLGVQARVEYLPMSSEEPPPPRGPKMDTEELKPPKPKSKNEVDGASDSINCNGNSCTVDRAFVAKLLANPALLARQGNARPYSRDDLKGFRLSRVKKGTIPRMLGLRSGDVLTAINGQPLNSLDGAMKLYAKLRNASHLTVDLTRNRSGQRQEVRIDISII